MSKKPCTHEYLAATESGKVLMCRECGVVHLHIENMSLHFDIASFLKLSDTLTEASAKIRAVPKTRAKKPALTLVH